MGIDAGRNETETRVDLIDPKLSLVGWGNVEGSIVRREYSITQGRIMDGGKRAAVLSADYVLEFRGRKLAVVDAKRESLSYTEGVRQAADYAQRLQCRITYATNGHDIYQMDLLTGEQRLVDEFLSPDALWQLSFDPATGVAEPDFAPVWRQRFAQISFESKGDWTPRDYQENAINNALEAIAQGENRILLTLATGTGKTCIAFQMA